MTAERFFDVGLWAAGAAHFVILIASAQVPGKLEWRKDLAQLKPFNRKLLWVQGGFTVLTIIGFAIYTLVFHRELLQGERSALGVAFFVALYWTARILVDAVYFSHADWPAGRQFVIGHALLTSLFIALATFYWALVGWHWM